MSKIRKIKETESGIAFYELTTDRIRMTVSNLGCHIISLETRDRDGRFADIVLGYQDVTDCLTDGNCLGAVVGRVANRIGGGVFTLNGREYPVAKNCGPHHLHGGLKGFNRQIFRAEPIGEGIRFTYHSPDGEEGYPGNLDVTVTYLIKDDQVLINFDCVSDADTIVNLTNHAYFNLSGHNPSGAEEAFPEKIYEHELRIASDRIACLDDTGLTTARTLSVEGTPFDFRVPRKVGERIAEDHEQIRNAGGYDHSWILSDDHDQISLVHPGSGRSLTISTSYPVVQVYTANYLSGGAKGKHGKPYENRDGIALETQFISNSIQVEEEPKVILRAGVPFHAGILWTFGLIG